MTASETELNHTELRTDYLKPVLVDTIQVFSEVRCVRFLRYYSFFFAAKCKLLSFKRKYSSAKPHQVCIRAPTWLLCVLCYINLRSNTYATARVCLRGPANVETAADVCQFHSYHKIEVIIL